MIFEKITWTTHSKFKMRQYRFSENRVLRILRKPDRREEGIALNTIANMQVAGTKKHPTEVWMMYQTIKSKAEICQNQIKREIKTKPSVKIRIISAWRYPGRTKKGNKPIIPEDTLNELDNILKK